MNSTEPSTTPDGAPASAALRADAARDRAFAAKLYRSLAVEATDNLCFSPASIRIAVAMAAVGARGDTAAQLTRTLEIDPDPATAATTAGEILALWKKRGVDPVTPDMPAWRRAEVAKRRELLRVVNRAWVQTGRRLQPPFLALLADGFAAPLAELDFEADPEKARRAINMWVEQATAAKIRDLLAPRSLSTDSRLVVANAVYFKAAWAFPFDKSRTRVGAFKASVPIEVPMMELTEKLGYAEVDNARVLALPYAAGTMTMVVVLPRRPADLPALEARLDEATLRSWLPTKTVAVHLVLPRFKVEAGLSLAPILQRLGARDAFAFGAADFSGIDGTRDILLSAVVHRALVAVDEDGTEAAAATAVAIEAGGAPATTPIEFHVDRPFLFFVRDDVLGHTLFMGRVADPRG